MTNVDIWLCYAAVDGAIRMLQEHVDSASPKGIPMSEKTIFKKIIDGEIPANIVHEDNLCLAFHDVNPQAPVHVLVIPRKEIASTDAIEDDDRELLGHVWCVIRDLAKEFQLQDGYRVVVNCGNQGGQTVPHLHFHLLGGPVIYPGLQANLYSCILCSGSRQDFREFSAETVMGVAIQKSHSVSLDGEQIYHVPKRRRRKSWRLPLHVFATLEYPYKHVAPASGLGVCCAHFVLTCWGHVLVSLLLHQPLDQLRD